MHIPQKQTLLQLIAAIGLLLFQQPLFAHDLTIVCSSYGKAVKRCPVDRAGKATLVEQLSLATCQKGRSWGQSDTDIWVKRGCRARFKVSHIHNKDEKLDGSPAKTVSVISTPSKTRKNINEVYCASPYRNHHKCRNEIRGKVRLIHEFSNHACRFGKSWGFNRRGIWVNKGCVGLFRILPFPTAIQSQNVRCESYGRDKNYCPAPFPGDAQLVDKLSLADCVQDAEWGYDAKGIWVANGCRAQFKVFHRGNPYRIPNWMLGKFIAYDKGRKLKMLVTIHPYGISKAKINETNIHAELNGDILSLNNRSYEIERVNNGFKAINTVRGGYHSLLFTRIR